MDILDKIKKYNDEEINEGFFGDIIGVYKVSKQLVKMTADIEKIAKDKVGEVVLTNDLMNRGLKIIQQSDLSSDMKDTMRKGFLGGIFKKLYSTSGLSGGELREKYGWSQALYNEMSRASRDV